MMQLEITKMPKPSIESRFACFIGKAPYFNKSEEDKKDEILKELEKLLDIY